VDRTSSGLCLMVGSVIRGAEFPHSATKGHWSVSQFGLV
jgi:hypothetical protein